MPESRTHTSVTGLAATLLAQGVGGNHTGDTNETVLATIPVPAGAMGANGLIVVRAKVQKTGTAGTMQTLMRFGLSGAGLTGAQVWASAASGSTVLMAEWLVSLSNLNNAGSQLGGGGANSGLGTLTTALTAAIDTTQATDFVISGVLANSGDTITLAFYQAILYPHA